jgi:glutaminyl-tRNA synthetase
MPTLAGLRRRGITPRRSLFIKRAGVAKAYSVIDAALLEHCARMELNETAPRATAVLDPVKVIVENYPEGAREPVAMENHPAKPERGEHTLHFSREIFIEREDFMENPPKKFFRLCPGGEVSSKAPTTSKSSASRRTRTELRRIISLRSQSKSGREGLQQEIQGHLHWLRTSTLGRRRSAVRLYVKDARTRVRDGGRGRYDGDHSARPTPRENFNGIPSP